jgi:hypothetical protein
LYVWYLDTYKFKTNWKWELSGSSQGARRSCGYRKQ